MKPCKRRSDFTPVRAGALWALAALAGCGGGSLDDEGRAAALAVAPGLQLPYDIYLPGTMTQWAQTDANRFRFDAANGVYRFDNLRAGPAGGSGDPRRFKITGAGWAHQFGLGVNGSATSVAQSTLQFAGSTSTTTLRHFDDSKDLFLPLESDATDPSGESLLDFEVKVLESGAAPAVQLTVTRDLPTLTRTLSITAPAGGSATMGYRGDGRYVGALLLSTGANAVTVKDEGGRSYQGSAAAGNGPAPLAACAAACTATLEVPETYFYEVTVDAPQGGGAMSISLRKMSLDEAKAVAPHFDADGEPLAITYPAYARQPGGRSEQVQVSVADRAAALRTFTLSSTQEQRDNAPRMRVAAEDPARPAVRSGNLLFDALFAMAVDDARLNSVSAIRDGNYGGGQDIACDCFQTGEKWTYVWTRDLAYAADLGLAWFDPQRVRNSMLFKTSGWRPGVQAPVSLPAGSLQIVQDTGSGGSWPVSTDRVSWAWAAERVLDNLGGVDRERFAQQAYAALRGTLEADRQAAYDAGSGLYGGEQSYLDWRTQTYAPWIVDDLSRMSTSKSLSTNIGHFQALRLTARLARERADLRVADKYQGWAEDLKAAINDTFWLEDARQYASLTGPAGDPAPVHKFDMLATALAVLSGVAPEERAREALARYPHAPFGVPVYYPQQPGVPVYHNRAIWPFVTGYALKAAARLNNTSVADHAFDSLVRGAALNLSNMENLEWLTGKPWYDDGPAINSRRQLWSVAAYLGMVTETVFGYQVEHGGLRIEPFLTPHVRQALGHARTATLERLNYKGRPVKIVLHLPQRQDAHEGHYEVQQVTLNGRPVRGLVSRDELQEQGNTIEVRFGRLDDGDARLTLAPQVSPDSHDDPRAFSPHAPVVDAVTLGGNTASLVISDAAHAGAGQAVRYSVYRDGIPVQAGLGAGTWTDPAPVDPSRRTCYAVEAVFTGSGNRSHRSAPRCLDADAAQNVAVSDTRVRSNLAVTPPSDGIAEPTLRNWGRPGDQLAVAPLELAQGGTYAVELRYDNHRHDISSGVTNAVKLLRVLDAAGTEVARGVVQMPNVDPRDGGHPIRTSTPVRVELAAGTYRVELKDFFNMSYLDTNANYSGAGGQGGPVNDSSIASIQVTRLDGPPH